MSTRPNVRSWLLACCLGLAAAGVAVSLYGHHQLAGLRALASQEAAPPLAAELVRAAERAQRGNLFVTAAMAVSAGLLLWLLGPALIRSLRKPAPGSGAGQAWGGSDEAASARGEAPADLPPVAEDGFGALAPVGRFGDRAQRLELLADADALTGLPNRARFEQALQSALDDCGLLGLGVALLLLDLDNVKAVNDSLGTELGDRYLREAARRLQRLVPPGGFLSHQGGDEFAVLLPGLPPNDAAHARVAAEAARLLHGLSAPCPLDGHSVPMSASIGVAMFPQDGYRVQDLNGCADAAMYLAKRSGRNTVQYGTAGLGEEARAHLRMGAEIRRGAERDEFEPFYQPMLDVERREVIGAEALLRWRHPSRGIVVPAEFMPVAEESGSAARLGEACLRRGCAQAALWHASGRTLNLAINLSPRQLGEVGLYEMVQRALELTRLAPARLELEMSESNVMESPDETVRLLKRLKELGVRLCIDNFGTGYSSLSYLQRLPVDKIKLARSFVSRLGTSREADAIVSTTLAMAETLGLNVMAEGVETVPQMRRLQALGCLHQQGYLFSPPLPAPELEYWMETAPGQIEELVRRAAA